MKTAYISSPCFENELLLEFASSPWKAVPLPDVPERPADLLVIDLRRPEPAADTPETILTAYDDVAIWAFSILRRALPALERGEGKRIAVLTTRDSSNSACLDTGRFAVHMPLAACNMFFALSFNQLRPRGYSFRMLVIDDSLCGLAEACLTDRSFEEVSFRHSDENRFVLRSLDDRELPF